MFHAGKVQVAATFYRAILAQQQAAQVYLFQSTGGGQLCI